MAHDPVLGAVGPRLRALRRQRGATLAGLSELTGVSVSTLSRLESGGRKPTLQLLLAMARPAATLRVPGNQVSVMLVIDVSGSMRATDVKPTRLAAAREAARTFVGKVPRGVRVGVMAFNQHPRTLQPPTADHGAARDALDQLASSGGARCSWPGPGAL